jgi:cholesterol oxidase
MTGPAPQPLATEELPEDAAVVVVGSGFGASITAARIAGVAGHGGTVVLERGREWLPGEFPQSFGDVRSALRSRSNPFGLFDLTLGADVDRLIANGLGGGSLIYGNVMLEPRREVFDEHWPTAIDSTAMAPYYARVRSVLEPECVPEPLVEKATPLVALATAHGRSPERVPLAIRLTPRPVGTGAERPVCTGCGNCVTGCNVRAKTTMWESYLPMAARAGARIVTGIEVERVEPRRAPGRRWSVIGVRRTRAASGRIVRKPFEMAADTVVLGAGSIGSTSILLRSAAAGLALSRQLGERFSGNADSLGVSYNSGSRLSGTGAKDSHMPEGAVGPTITAMLDLRDGASGYLLQDGALPYALAEALRRVLGLRFAASRDSKVWCDVRPGGCPAGCGAIEHSQVWLAMGTDSAMGRIVLDRRREPRIVWAGSGSQPVYAAQLADLMALSSGERATFVGNPRRALLHRGMPAATPITVHPLGGAVMADDVDHGVCDADGRVFDPAGGVHDGLVVADGALVPTSTGSNPALTIAALAERVAERLIERLRPTAPAEREPGAPR